MSSKNSPEYQKHLAFWLLLSCQFAEELEDAGFTNEAISIAQIIETLSTKWRDEYGETFIEALRVQDEQMQVLLNGGLN